MKLVIARISARCLRRFSEILSARADRLDDSLRISKGYYSNLEAYGSYVQAPIVVDRWKGS